MALDCPALPQTCGCGWHHFTTATALPNVYTNQYYTTWVMWWIMWPLQDARWLFHVQQGTVKSLKITEGAFSLMLTLELLNNKKEFRSEFHHYSLWRNEITRESCDWLSMTTKGLRVTSRRIQLRYNLSLENSNFLLKTKKGKSENLIKK